MRFIPCHLLGNAPNVVVDGGNNPSTVCSLSHWPHSGTNSELKDDLSAQIVFHYLDRPDLQVDIDSVTNDHFDEDGLVGLFSIINPAEAQRHRELLVDIANAGDFGRYKFRQAARVAFVLATYADSQQSPLPGELFKLPYPEFTGEMYKIMLPLLPDIVANTESYSQYWEREDSFLGRSEEAIRSGSISIRELPELDLAIVTLPEESESDTAHKLNQRLNSVCHPIAIHNKTDCFRILLMQGKHYQLYYRYETWVQYMSRRPMLRADLTGLAERLSLQESGDTKWVFTGVQRMDANLHLTGSSQSAVLPDAFVEQVISFLSQASPAWDPYD